MPTAVPSTAMPSSTPTLAPVTAIEAENAELKAELAALRAQAEKPKHQKSTNKAAP
jgi:hypothetical protein